LIKFGSLLTICRFPQFKAAALEPCLEQLNQREPALKAIAEFVRQNIYRYIQDRVHLPERPVVGIGLGREERAELTVMELFDLPEPSQPVVPVFNVFGGQGQVPRSQFMVFAAETETEMAASGANPGSEEDGDEFSMLE
jgi:hypothetical protein